LAIIYSGTMINDTGPNLIAALGRPDLQIAGLQIWIQDRQFPDSSDYWDGNWLYCTLHCGGPDSDVWLKKDPFIHIPELQRFYSSLMAFSSSMSGSARLETMEENLNLVIQSSNSQEIVMDVFITSNPALEEHHYTFSVTRDHVEDLLKQLNSLLSRFPIKGQPLSA
jgi:hypothetical protein